MMHRNVDVFAIPQIEFEGFESGVSGHAFGRIKYGDDHETINLFLTPSQVVALHAQIVESLASFRAHGDVA